MICCGFWNFHDLLLFIVESSCETASLDQLKHLNALFVPFIRDQCVSQGFEHGSSPCQSLLLIPLLFAILLIVFILVFCLCSCFSFQQMLRLRRDYRRVVNGQAEPQASAPQVEIKPDLSLINSQA